MLVAALIFVDEVHRSQQSQYEDGFLPHIEDGNTITFIWRKPLKTCRLNLTRHWLAPVVYLLKPWKVRDKCLPGDGRQTRVAGGQESRPAKRPPLLNW